MSRAVVEPRAERRASLGRHAELLPYASHEHAQPEGVLHYLDEGPRAAEPLLCLHGNPTWCLYWRALVERFRERYRVVVPDHLGCGLSDKPAAARYDLAAHVERLEQLVLALDLERITLVVHDWGGAIGLGLASKQPERIARLVITNTAAFPSDRMPARIALARLPLVGELAVRGANAFARAATRMAVERPLPPELRDAYLAPYASWAERIAIWRFVRDIPMSPAHPSFATLRDIGERVASFSDRPGLCLWGERDWCFTPAFRRVWQERLPALEVHRFEQAGHWLMEDARDECLRTLEEWLARTPLSAGAVR